MAPTFELQERFRDRPPMTSTEQATPAFILHFAGGGFLTRPQCTMCSRDLHPSKGFYALPDRAANASSAMLQRLARLANSLKSCKLR